MKIPRSLLAAAIAFGGMGVGTLRTQAAMPVGSFTYTNSDAANSLWDLTKVTQLQNLDVSVSKLNASIHFYVTFSQDGAGKLAGSGTTDINVVSSAFTGTISGAVYKVTGKVSSKAGQVRLHYLAGATGTALIDGKDRAVKALAGRTVEFDNVTKVLNGNFHNSANAAGLGGGADNGDINYVWADIQTAVGDGGWRLQLTLADAGNNKLAGAATVTLDSGAVWLFVVKGVYNPRTDSTKLVLLPTAGSKGSALKVQMTGSQITGILGKVSGQTVKLSPAP